MQHKTVIFIADSLDNAHKFQSILSDMDVSVFAGSSLQFTKLIEAHPDFQLVIYELREESADQLPAIEKAIAEEGQAALLVIAKESFLERLHLSSQSNRDFCLNDSSVTECSVRVRQLLWPGTEASNSDIVVVDNMTINLATYQVTVGGEPLDLTYLEYALLSFLATHPGRTYSRDALLRRVWGFDYYGGSRTVDVHVRRVRAKLGPALAQRLETVRGVGYLWTA